jgi:hypothetical protein
VNECTCSYDESEEMTRHSALCKLNAQEGVLPPAVLLCFVRHLIRNTCSRDALEMALASTKLELGMTHEQVKKFLNAILNEQAKGIWPEGF